MIKEEKYYLDLFGVTTSDLDMLIDEARSTGGGFADLFFENTIASDMLLRDCEVSSGGFNVDYGVGIRTLKGEKTGYAYSESTDKASMMAAARAAAAISDSPAAEPEATRPLFLGRPNRAADRYPARRTVTDTAGESAFLRKIDSLVRQKDPTVSKVIAMVSYQLSDILMYNSSGELKYESRPLCSVTVQAVFSRSGKTENSSSSRSWRMGLEMLTDALAEELAGLVTDGIDERFAAKRPRGGKMPVVMASGASGILLHEAVGHAFEADFNRKGQSVFSGRIGEKVCPDGITIVDDGTIRSNRGAVNFDDEGVPGQRTVMVENGVLTSYLHDRISAKWYDVRPTGNGRRESFRYNPIPRMRATYMESGDCNPEDIVKSVRRGIYVDKFSNGEVKIGEGDFTFYVRSGFLIENGSLTMPVKDINIMGNGPRAIADIRMVGSDLGIDDGAWTCGKGQSVPVSCGIPTVLVDNLVVGGE